MITLSNKLAKAVSDQAMDCINGRLHLQDADIKALTKILEDKQESPKDISRKRAVNAFIQVAAENKLSAVLEKVLLDPDEQIATRISAASAIGKYGDSSSEDALMNVVAKSSGHIRREVIKAMGRIGTEKSLLALQALPEDLDPGTEQARKFASTLITFRRDDISSLPKNIKNLLGGDWIKQQASTLSAKKLKEDILSLGSNTFGINLSQKLGYEINCGKITNKFFMNERLKAGKILQNLSEKPLIAGIVAIRNPREVISTIRYLVFTNPAETGVDILVTRTTGELVYAGEIISDGKLARFSIRDVGITGIPTNINGTISNDGIEFDVNFSNKRRVKVGQRI